MPEMKKVVLPKNVLVKRNNFRNGHRRTHPKKTLYSNWETRNDSSNVNAILHPDLETPRKFIHNVSTKPKNESEGVYRKCCLSTNTCYCREKPIKPRLLNRPNKCLSLETFQKNIKDDNLSRKSLRCFCKVVGDTAPMSNIYMTDSDMIKNYLEELEKNSTSICFTEQRNDYDLYREEQHKEFLKDLEEYEENKKRDEDMPMKDDDINGFEQGRELFDAVTVIEEEKDLSIATLLGTRKANSKFGSSGFLTDGLNIEELRQFRDDHYFETHVVDFSDEEIPKHTCIHQFKLDDRLLPTPMNADSYGRSRCSICNKPMEGDKVQLSKSYFSDKSSKVSLENFSKCYRMGLVPRAISIGGDKSKIELKLSEKNINQFGLFLGKYKKPRYTNTYALRQQKMTC